MLAALWGSAALAQGWVSAPLPEQPLGVFAHAGAFWVCGANGMIATSGDEARSWTVMRRQRGGALLFHLYFPGPGKIVAFGSEGARLESDDGGRSWHERALALERRFTLAAFAGPRIEYGARGNALAWTSDGGKTWKVDRMHAPGGAEAPITALAAAGGRAVALAGAGAQMAATTTDSGAHWLATALPETAHWGQVRVTAGEFFIYGKAADGGAEAQSSDSGVGWREMPRAPTVYSECRAEGCLVDGGWVDLRGAQPKLYARPPDAVQPLTSSWAAVGDEFCRVSTTLRCRRGRHLWRPARPAVYSAVRDAGVAVEAQALPPGVAGHAGLMVLVGRDGRVKQTLVVAADEKSAVQPMVDAVRRWRFAPLIIAGRAVEYSFFVGMIYQ